MKAKFLNQFSGALLIMFLALQASVANSGRVKLEGEPYTRGLTCGFPYTIGQQVSNGTDLIKKYVLSGRKWTTFPVTWGFLPNSAPPPDMDPQELLRAFQAGFEKWQGAVPKFAFKKLDTGNPNIKILFKTLIRTTFDRNYGFGDYPPVGLLRLDNHSGLWTTGTPVKNKLDLQSGMMHEAGHTLGMGHSTDKSAVMYPTLMDGILKRELTKDDIDGIQALYP